MDRRMTQPDDKRASSPSEPAEVIPRRGHAGVLIALALGTFAVGTEGFMIAAILPAIGGSLAVSVPIAGQLATAFTIVYALSSPILTAWTAHLSRRTLLLASLAAFGVANILAAAA